MVSSRRALFAVAAVIGAVALSGAALAQSASTPPAGSPERKAIMDAMRAKGNDQNRVLVVQRLRMANGWAWLDAEPQSRDGLNRYEAESALLRRTGSRWAVVDQPCSEESCNQRNELRRIRAAFPGAPASIFP